MISTQKKENTRISACLMHLRPNLACDAKEPGFAQGEQHQNYSKYKEAWELKDVKGILGESFFLDSRTQ